MFSKATKTDNVLNDLVKTQLKLAKSYIEGFSIEQELLDNLVRL